MFSIKCRVKFTAARTLCLVFYFRCNKRIGLASSGAQTLHPNVNVGRMFVNPQGKSSAKAFALLGTQRMAPPHSCFPSDHFGMDARFEW